MLFGGLPKLNIILYPYLLLAFAISRSSNNQPTGSRVKEFYSAKILNRKIFRAQPWSFPKINLFALDLDDIISENLIYSNLNSSSSSCEMLKMQC